MSANKTAGWDWLAFLLGPFWYLSKGMIGKGIWLLVLCIFTIFCAAPFIWVYCGARGRGDWYDYRLKAKSKFNLDEL